MIMFRALLAISFASALAAPSVAQWDAVTYDPASAVHTEGFLIVHDDGSDLMAFSAMAQEWMPIAASGSQVLGTGDFCAAFRTTSGSLAAYSARLHACRTAPIPLGITMIDVQVADDVVLALYEYGGDVFALGYSTENNAWAQLALGAVPPSSLQYGAERFVEMARAHSGCEVLHQDFLALDLPERRFDGVFANAALFHVPSQELPRVLGALRAALVEDGVLFSSNPHGPNREGWSGDRYACYLDLDTYRQFLTAAGFVELEHYYRPTGRPRAEQPWLASVWRRAPG